jgi:hypothetical protein
MTPRQQLDAFLKKYDPAIAKLGNAAMLKLRKRLPSATVLVYDNYNALVMGFSATDRPSDAILSVALYPKWVTLFFLHGATLPDPHKLLVGSGKQVRGLRIESLATLDEPAVSALIQAAAEQGELAPGPTGKLVIQSISPKQRPRRPIASIKR